MTIAAVDRTLVELLRSGLEAISVPADRVATISPTDAGTRDILCGAFLYASIENPSLKNEPPRPDPANPHSAMVRAPLTLDLYYLITAYGSGSDTDASGREQSAHLVLSTAMRTLYDVGVITGSQMDPALRDSGIDELRVSLNPITVEDMTRIWSVFPNQTYRPSVSYLLSPIPIQSEQVSADARVTQRRQEAGTTTAPLEATERRGL